MSRLWTASSDAATIESAIVRSSGGSPIRSYSSLRWSSWYWMSLTMSGSSVVNVAICWTSGGMAIARAKATMATVIAYTSRTASQRGSPTRAKRSTSGSRR